MRLRSIETVGFKSFADKIEINFTEGITAIVGPNGSGKSNVSDAIRWVLGEQSMKTLRGSSMEDVIFSGSGKRKALNIAEVTLLFSNSAGILPVEYKEVAICRRLFRSGESAYFINKTPCRLKDIHDLFADTGLGKGSLSIIGQNKVDEILNARPEDRRVIFEETAGIVKHKLRKKEALKRLEETDNNLVRLNDIRSEIFERLEPMRENAEKTRLYNTLFADFQQTRITQAVRKIEKAEEMLTAAELQMKELEGQAENLTTEINIKENNAFLLKEKIQNLNEDLSNCQQEIAALQALLEKLAGQKSVLFERIGQTKERILNLQVNETKQLEQLTSLEQQLADFSGRLAEQKRQEEQAQQAKEELEKQLGKMKGKIHSLEVSQSQEQIDILERKRAIMQLGNELREKEVSLANNKRKKEQLKQEQEKTQAKFSELEKESQELQQKLAACQNKKEQLSISSESLQAEKNTCSEQINKLAAEEKVLTDRRVAWETRVNILQKMQASYEGFSYAVKRILGANEAWRKGIIGTVGQLIEVSPKYVVAIETALGSSIQNIVTTEEITAKNCIEFLKSQHAGRATFLPLNKIKPPFFSESDAKLLALSEVLGRADSLLAYEQTIRPAIEFLLARTLIVENIAAALKVNNQGNTKFRLVTLEGDVLHAAGSMSGGSRNSKENGFLSRKKEITENQLKLEQLKLDLGELGDKQSRLKEQFRQNEEKIERLGQENQENTLELTRLNLKKEEFEKALYQVNLTLEALEFEAGAAEEEMVSLRLEIMGLQKSKKQAELEDEAQSESAKQDREALEEAREGLAELENAYHEANLRLQMAHNSTNLLAEQSADLELRQANLRQEQNAVQENIEILQNNICQAEQEKEDTTAQIAAQQEKLAQVKSKHDELSKVNLDLLPEQNELERKLASLKRDLNAVQNRLRSAEGIFVRYQTELELALAQLQENFSLTLAAAKQQVLLEISEKELEYRSGELESRLDALGPVNHTAIEEYAELKERFDFIMQQYEDLIKAKEDLRLLLSEIDNIMIKRFKEAFTAINLHFTESFAKLFGGGSASLKLVEPAEILSTGIEIIVQPPGKKMQTLSLLSGGERALTVIALLFALLSYKPAPFCVLDEIDAALDEANVERFKNFVLDYATHTQFVIITHRKSTMQAADILHGITMEETGVSKLVSLKIKERKEASA